MRCRNTTTMIPPTAPAFTTASARQSRRISSSTARTSRDWPEQEALAQNILLRVCSKIMDKVTTTDELIPSGETSSYRSNPLGLAEFTLSRRDPGYVQRAKDVRALEKARLAGEAQSDEALKTHSGK